MRLNGTKVKLILSTGWEHDDLKLFARLVYYNTMNAIFCFSNYDIADGCHGNDNIIDQRGRGRLL